MANTLYTLNNDQQVHNLFFFHNEVQEYFQNYARVQYNQGKNALEERIQLCFKDKIK